MSRSGGGEGMSTATRSVSARHGDGGASSTASTTRPSWDGLLILSVVSKVYKPVRELWGVGKGLDTVVPRGVWINFQTPDYLAQKVLQQHERKERNEHHFPVVKVRLGLRLNGKGDDVGKDDQVEDDDALTVQQLEEASRDPRVVSALSLLPPKLKELEFEYYFDSPVDLQHVLVDDVMFGPYFDSEVKLPTSARVIIFSEAFNKQVVLPAGLKLVSFGLAFNQPLSLPAGLEHLEFDDDDEGSFNQPLDLPPSLKVLLLGVCFDQRLELPVGVERLELCRNLSHPIAFPVSLRTVGLCDSFNQAVDLPSGLETLRLGPAFNHPLQLPMGLKVVMFAHNSVFNQPLSVPPNIREVELGSSFNRPLELPLGVERVQLGRDFSQPILIPKSVRILDLSRSLFNHPLKLSEGLEELLLGPAFDQPLSVPQSVRKLALGNRVSPALVLPAGLQKLSFRKFCSFNDFIALPVGLEEIEFGGAFSQPCHGVSQPLVIPPCVRKLTLPGTFNWSLKLSTGLLRELSFSMASEFNYSIELPVGLEKVELGAAFRQQVKFPKGLTFARLSRSHENVELPEGEEGQWTIEEHQGFRFYSRKQ